MALALVYFVPRKELLDFSEMARSRLTVRKLSPHDPLLVPANLILHLVEFDWYKTPPDRVKLSQRGLKVPSIPKV